MSTVTHPIRPAHKVQRSRRARTRIPNRQFHIATPHGTQTISIASNAARILDHASGIWGPELPTVFPVAITDPCALLPLDPFSHSVRLLCSGAFGSQILEISIRNPAQSGWRPIHGDQCPVTLRELTLDLDGAISSAGFRFDPAVESWEPAVTRQDGPAITQCPALIQPGDRFEIGTPNAREIQTVALVSGVAFHALLFEERGPVISSQASWTIPAGEYSLVVINREGEVSQARPLRLESPAPGGTVRRGKVVVTEATGDTDTGIDLEPGDEFEIQATGSIPSGRVGVADAPPKGWQCLLDKTAASLWNQEADVTAQSAAEDREFPVMRGIHSRPFALLAKLGEQGSYFAPDALQSHRGLSKKRLYLRINSDRPNGSGAFTSTVTVHSRRVRRDVVWIESVRRSPERVVLKLRTNVREPLALDRWYVTNRAGVRTPVPTGGRASDHPDGLEVVLPSDVAASSDRIALHAPDGSTVSAYCF